MLVAEADQTGARARATAVRSGGAASGAGGAAGLPDRCMDSRFVPPTGEDLREGVGFDKGSVTDFDDHGLSHCAILARLYPKTVRMFGSL